MDADEAVVYLSQYLNKTLRVYTNDGRMFSGTMRCTDKDRNMILSITHEYRQPTEKAVKAAIEESGNPTAHVPMTSRFVGLVVVPGQYITRIEYEPSNYSRDTVVP